MEACVHSVDMTEWWGRSIVCQDVYLCDKPRTQGRTGGWRGHRRSTGLGQAAWTLGNSPERRGERAWLVMLQSSGFLTFHNWSSPPSPFTTALHPLYSTCPSPIVNMTMVLCPTQRIIQNNNVDVEKDLRDWVTNLFRRRVFPQASLLKRERDRGPPQVVRCIIKNDYLWHCLRGH